MIYASTKQTLSERGRQQFCLKSDMSKTYNPLKKYCTQDRSDCDLLELLLSACLSKLKEIDEDARIITGKAWLYRLNISGLNTKAEYTI